VTALAALTRDCPALVGRLHSWDISTGVDGPGTRLAVFLSGCPLRCLYCHNPDTWSRHGTPTEVAELGDLIRRYGPFVALAGGGLTVSGGEPLQQPAFTQALLAEAKKAGLETALDTSGFLGRRASDELLDLTDLVLLDIKAGSDATHRALTGRPLAPTVEFARRLAARGDRVWVRYVLVPGYNDDPAEVDAVAKLCVELGNVERVEVLPFHKLGEAKYAELGLQFPLADTPTPSHRLRSDTRKIFMARGLAVPS
jgi:pyruvate formate lyase activating enzyme